MFIFDLHIISNYNVVSPHESNFVIKVRVEHDGVVHGEDRPKHKETASKFKEDSVKRFRQIHSKIASETEYKSAANWEAFGNKWFDTYSKKIIKSKKSIDFDFEQVIDEHLAIMKSEKIQNTSFYRYPGSKNIFVKRYNHDLRPFRFSITTADYDVLVVSSEKYIKKEIYDYEQKHWADIRQIMFDQSLKRINHKRISETCLLINDYIHIIL